MKKKKLLLKIFEKVEKTGIISTKFSFRCTPSVILGLCLFFIVRFKDLLVIFYLPSKRYTTYSVRNKQKKSGGYTVVRHALWIYRGKPCPFHIMSLPSEYKAKLPAAGSFSLKQRVKTFCLQYLPSKNNSVPRKIIKLH